MGFFDRFRKQAPSPAPIAARAPSLPARAAIGTFVLVDGVGTLAVEDGPPIRFGRSACRGFEPVVGARVLVEELQPHPLGGWRATRIVLDGDGGNYDALIMQRDAALGIPKPDPVQEAAAIGNAMGWIVFLLADAPPTGPAALAQWFRDLRVQDDGIEVDTAGAITLRQGTLSTSLCYVGPGPFPEFREMFGAGIDPGAGFLVVSLGNPGMTRTLRAAGVSLDDPWEQNGRMRQLSRLSAALAKRSQGVLLPQAGTAFTRDSFLARLGDPGDVSHRPFGAWVGFGQANGSQVSSLGMVLHGLPDVEVAVTPGDAWERSRAYEAVVHACHRMVWENRELQEGELLRVPVGVQLGAKRSPHGASDDDGVEEFRVRSPGDRFVLERTDPLGLRGRWRPASDRAAPNPELFPPNAYRELFRQGFCSEHTASVINGLTTRPQPPTPVFEVDLAQLEDGGFLMVTNGLGRVPQPRGRVDDGVRHVELVAAMASHHPLLAQVIATVGAMIHQHQGGAETFKVGDTVGLEVSEIGAKGFVLADAGWIQMADGEPIHLLELVPLSAEEYLEVRRASGPFREQLGPMTPATRAARWSLQLN